jgi:hypothetical protein
MKKLLILSNGHGEDLVAAELIRNLRLNAAVPEIEIDIFPLVGDGKAFKNLPIKLIGPLKNFPSGGFSVRNIFALPKDLFSGYFQNLHEQYLTLKKIKGNYDLSIGIGDLIPLLSAIIVGCPFIFIGVNKTDYYHSFGYSYTPWEKWLLKKSKLTFTRDKLTASNLESAGIKALHAGNPLMDCILTPPSQSSGTPLHEMERGNKGMRIGFLPGSREKDIPLNIQDFSLIAQELMKFDKHFEFLIATDADVPLDFIKAPFAEVLARSDVMVGLSGTGNEQAAGFGKPVVAFPGRGSQYTSRFAKAQKQLLSEALCLTKRNPVKVAEEVWSILNDHGRYEYMSHVGQERMGKPGAIDKIVQYVLEALK